MALGLTTERMFLTVVAGYATIVDNGNSGCGNDRCGRRDEVKRKATRVDVSGLETRLGVFFEENPAKRKLVGKRSGVSLADM